MKQKKFVAAFLFFFCVLKNMIFSLEVPPLKSPVTDNARIMSQKVRAELEEYLFQISKNSSAQIAVLTIPSLENANLEEYAIQVSRKWGLGQAQDSKGVLLLIAMKEKKIRIEAGYGAEGDLTDAKCGLIIRNAIAPNFQSGNYEKGIVAGTKEIAKIVAPDASAKKIGAKIEEGGRGISSFAAIAIFFVLYFIMFSGSLSRKYRAFYWFPWAGFFSGRRSRPRTGYYRNFSENNFGGGIGSSSHKSFKGGGGEFGGGGASGGW